MSEATARTASGWKQVRVLRPGRYWLAAASILWVAGLSKGMNVITLLGYLMILLWLLNAFLAGRGLNALHIGWRRRPPPCVFAHDSVPIEVEIVNQGARALESGRIELDSTDQSAACFVDLEPGQPYRLNASFVPETRGWYHFAPPRVHSGFPFGLVERVAEGQETCSVLVYPALGDLDAGRLSRLLAGGSGDDGLRRRRASVGDEFHGLREFRDGDSPRCVHWRTSARRGELMVKEFDEYSARDLIVVLDPHVPEGAAARQRREEEARLEWAVSLTATICREWCREAGSRLVLAVAGPGRPILVDSETGAEQASLYLECLALVQGVATPDHAALLERLADLAPDVPVVLVGLRRDDLASRLRSAGRQVIALGHDHELVAELYEEPTSRGEERP